jgi:nicotinamidase-related amidase
MTHALLLIDIQNDYFPSGAFELEGTTAAGEAAGKLLAAFRERALPVVHVQHLSVRPGATFFLPDTEGARIYAAVAPHDGEALIIKHFPNAFRETRLLATLRELGATQLTVAGMMSHMCIDTSVRAAADLGFACTLAHDACATRAQTFEGHAIPAAEVHRAFMAALNGAFAQVKATADIIAGL